MTLADLRACADAIARLPAHPVTYYVDPRAWEAMRTRIPVASFPTLGIDIHVSRAIPPGQAWAWFSDGTFRRVM